MAHKDTTVRSKCQCGMVSEQGKVPAALAKIYGNNRVSQSDLLSVDETEKPATLFARTNRR